MITSLLIANRGEIACRVIRTARRMNIRTVAVYSDADAKALHVRQADEAVHIGPSPARESYLVGERMIAAALQTGAEAIHPGYGFLSENADFAQSVIDSGLIWVGPAPASIRAMGLKDAAKQRMIAAGVPVTPGYLGADQSPERLRAEADAIGYPVLIKAVAGGGGKGMRRVDASADFADALQSCRREAASSFGDDRVLIEKYILSPRHIEVQVFGDTHGNVVHLFERDCSLQRRHQKVIEEAPAPGMDEATREAVCGAAVKAAQAVDYVGAGTIEFIADTSDREDGGSGLRADRIWFMEMNTRLQVEHPVTEEITGVDLVEWQLRVASGEPLPKRQDELRIDGWAIEARLYAEDPEHDFLPSPGQIDRLVFGKGLDAIEGVTKEREARLRIDTGVEKGDVIATYYDPMIGKLIVRHKTRDRAILLMRETLNDTQVWPLRTNAGFLHQLLGDEAVFAGQVTTSLIAGLPQLRSKPPLSRDGLEVAAVMVLEDNGFSLPSIATPKGAMVGVRLNAPAEHEMTVYVDGVARRAPLTDRERGVRPRFWRDGAQRLIFEGGYAYRASLEHRPSSSGAAADGAILAPMPGRIIAVEVAAGETVVKGQKLVTLEAMKMEHTLTAPFDGMVAELNAVDGGQVTEGAMLVRVERND